MSDTGIVGRRVLMLVSGFPPARQVILRTVKFTKYLQEYGWEPVVVTPLARKDTQFMVVPQGVLVKRTPRFSTLSTLVASTRRLTVPGSATSAVSTSRVGRMGFASAINTAARRALLWSDTPDAFAGWIPFAVATGWWLARSYEASVIQASGPPFSVIVAGAILSRLTGLPLVSDFRDVWTLDEADPIGTLGGSFRAQLTARRVRLLKSLERWVLTCSAAVLFTSRATRMLYVDAYPEIERKSHVIYNGVDLEDFVGEIRLLERPTVAHVGTLHEFQWSQVDLFLRGFSRALRRRTIPPDTQVIFAGSIGLKLHAQLEGVITVLGISESVRVTNFVPHIQAVQWMRNSHLLLLFAGQNRYVRLSKTSEYIAAGPPMLAFAPQVSETAEEMRRYGSRVLDDASEEMVEAELVDAFSRQAKRRPPALSAVYHPHPLNRRTEAQYLAQILDMSVAMLGTQESSTK